MQYIHACMHTYMYIGRESGSTFRAQFHPLWTIQKEDPERTGAAGRGGAPRLHSCTTVHTTSTLSCSPTGIQTGLLPLSGFAPVQQECTLLCSCCTPTPVVLLYNRSTLQLYSCGVHSCCTPVQQECTLLCSYCTGPQRQSTRSVPASVGRAGDGHPIAHSNSRTRV